MTSFDFPILSLLDDRLRTKGTRDPLGFEAIWTGFGRRLIGNLTTITSSLDNFIITLVGCHLAHNLARGKDDLALKYFLGYEQLMAYARHAQGDPGTILGILRVRKAWNQADPEGAGDDIVIGGAGEILSSQASYGLWGLYTAALVSTGLLNSGTRVPTSGGAALAEEFLSAISQRTVQQLQLGMKNDGTYTRDEILERFVPALQMLSSAEPRRDLATGLLSGGQGATAVQAELVNVASRYLATQENDSDGGAPAFVAWLLATDGISVNLRERAHAIQALDKGLVLGNVLFDFARGCSGNRLTAAADEISENLNFATLTLDPPFDLFPDVDSGIRKAGLEKFAKAVNNGSAADAVRALADLNGGVMEARGSAPWLECRGQEIKARVPNRRPELPRTDEVLQRWDYTYFLDSFLALVSQFQLGAEGR